MKILAITEDKDNRFFSLLKPIESCEFQIGITEQVDINAINQFRPDIIIHNTNKIIPYQGLKIKIDLNKVDPFIDIMTKKPVKEKRFECDFSFIGDLNLIDKELVKFVFNHKTKIYNNNPNGTAFYAGCINVNDIYSIYASSKGVLFVPGMNFSDQMLLDISYSNSIPVSNVDDAKSLISGELKFLKKNSVSTNFDAISKILKTSGLEKISKLVLDKKKDFK